jgi:hypothetical protein
VTLAIAALFPWQRLQDYLSSLTHLISFQEGVILLSDSRWTYENDFKEDMGQKVWPLSPSAIAVYAGDVLTAEESLTQLSQACLRNGIARGADIALVSSIIFRRVYNSRFPNPDDRRPVYYLIGLFHQTEGAAVIRTSSTTGFQPLFTRGISTIGRTGAGREFEHRSRQAVDRALAPDQSKSLRPEGWAPILAGVLHLDVIEKQVDPTVGGPVQIAVVDGEGARRFDMHKLHMEEPIHSVKITAGIEELEQYRKSRIIPRLLSGAFDMEFYQVD